MFLVVPSAVFVPLWRRLSLRTGKLRGYLAASTLFGVTALSLLLARVEPEPVVFVQMGLLGIGYAGMQLFPYAMLPGRAGRHRELARRRLHRGVAGR